MNSRHILLLPSWYPVQVADVNGVFFRDQAVALSCYGHRVGVVAVYMRPLRAVFQPPTARAGADYELDEGIPTYRKQAWSALPRVPYGKYWLWKRAARSLLNQYVREQGWPDLVHAHSAIYAGAVAAEWGRENDIPIVLTEHSSGFARHVYRPWQLKLAEGAAVGADTCIAVSPALAEVLEEQVPRSRGRWVSVPNVVADRFHGGPERKDNVARALRFLNLAIMSENKGQMDLLEAFSRAFGGAGDSAELWLGGDGPLRDALEARARGLRIKERVRFLGQIPPQNVPDLLGQVDAMVVSSHFETFGLVAAEALMAGVRVVATRCGGPEYIVGEGDGYLVPPRSPQALAEALMQVAESSGEVNHRDISERARARFSGETVARQLTRMYDDVLARHPRTAVTAWPTR